VPTPQTPRRRREGPAKDPNSNMNHAMWKLAEDIAPSHPLLARSEGKRESLADKWRRMSIQPEENYRSFEEAFGDIIFDSSHPEFEKAVNKRKARGGSAKVFELPHWPQLTKMVEYINHNEFHLPLLQNKATSQQTKTITLVHEGKRRSVSEIYHCPNFKSSSFNPEEDVRLKHNLRTFLYQDLQLEGPEEACQFLRELLHKDLCGKPAGMLKLNHVKARHYFAAFVAGPEMVAYRLTWDIFSRLVRLILAMSFESGASTPTQKASRTKQFAAEEANTILDHLFEAYDNLLPSEKPENIMSYFENGPGYYGPANTVWKKIGSELSRKPKSVATHFNMKLLPILKMNRKGLDPSEIQSWQKEFLELVDDMPDDVRFAEDVNVDNIRRDHFPECTKIQLRKFVDNIKKQAQRNGGLDCFREAVRTRLDRLQIGLDGESMGRFDDLVTSQAKGRKGSRSNRKEKSATKLNQWIEEVCDHFDNLVRKSGEEAKENTS